MIANVSTRVMRNNAMLIMSATAIYRTNSRLISMKESSSNSTIRYVEGFYKKISTNSVTIKQKNVSTAFTLSTSNLALIIHCAVYSCKVHRKMIQYFITYLICHLQKLILRHHSLSNVLNATFSHLFPPRVFLFLFLSVMQSEVCALTSL